MPAIYLCDVTGTGTHNDPWRPVITTTGALQALAIDSVEKKGQTKAKGIYWSDDNNATGVFLQAAQGATGPALLAAMQSTNVPTNRRNQINTWLVNSGNDPLPAGTISVLDAVVFVCQQIEPTLDVPAFILSH